MSDSGGPVAQTSKSEANGESDFGPTGEALDKLNPCEMAKSQRGKKGNAELIFMLQYRNQLFL